MGKGKVWLLRPAVYKIGHGYYTAFGDLEVLTGTS